MSSDRSSDYFRPSLLDRLLEGDADEAAPGPRSRQDDPYRFQDFNEFSASLCRDLEDLLNARSSAGDVPPWAKSCASSILNFGLPDRAYDTDPAGAARMVRDTIAAFEPRLRDVRVEPLGVDADRPDRGVLEIRARLVAERGTSIRLWVQLRSTGVDRITVTRAD